eukprot:TRINITY_DN71782_c0_g1_i2.p1 TRINITY_DN71782_c0_g1~~TRINITY_DN71782_c0_g1_i2.p1  ORF type:complete len:242 (-),score=24.21 TRINITY_DN71782_c0_g1_i2:289-1014(-)
MRVKLILVLIYLPTVVLQDGLNRNNSCSQLHPECLFIAAVGLSGSTTLMDIVNQHPKVHIRGENVDLFGVIMKSIWKIQWQADYDQALQQRDWEKIKYFSNIEKQHAYYGVGLMFKQFYGHGENRDKIIGFKEIRVSNEQQVNFLRGLCQKSKVIFQYHKDIEKVSQREWFGLMPNARNDILSQIKFFHEYNQKHPNDTFISTIDDFKKADFVPKLFNFLGLSLEGINIDTGRLFHKIIRV